MYSYLEKEYGKNKKGMILGIVLLSLASLLLIVALVKTISAKNNAIHLNDAIIMEEGRKENRLSYLDTIGFYQFASYGDDLGYYIAYDDEFMYIITIKEKDFDYFADKFDDSDVVRIWGYTKAIPSDAIPYAIDAVNEDMGEQLVTTSNFEDMLGDVMLEAHRDSSINVFSMLFSIAPIELLIAALCLIFGLILFFVDRANHRSYEQYLHDEELKAELESEDTRVFENMKLALTDNHVVSFNGALKVLDYSDIFWAYLTKHRTNGIADYNFLNLCTRDGKQIICGNGNTFGKKNRTATASNHDEILSIIKEKNPDVLLGYDQENINAYSELVKANKENNV
ncbi:MAG: hypothetical protein IJI66_07455 [Erysipelotrichaceae bacterium]|nr:hypothetical protein [Erysipelotrichaceae bacterium]